MIQLIWIGKDNTKIWSAQKSDAYINRTPQFACIWQQGKTVELVLMHFLTRLDLDIYVIYATTSDEYGVHLKNEILLIYLFYYSFRP